MALRHGKIGRIVVVALAVAGAATSTLAGGGEDAPAPVAAPREGNPTTQALGSVWFRFQGSGEVTGYRHQLDLDTAIATTRYERGGVAFTREVFASPVDQVIVVRLVADQPGRIAFRAQLRGARNQAHSNYATDYFRMDGVGTDGLVVRGKSADYLGVRGALRYEARLQAMAEGGSFATGGRAR